MKMQNENVIIYASDSNYISHMAVSMLSIMETNKSESFYFLVLDNNIGEVEKNKVFDLCKNYGRRVTFYDINKYLHKIDLNTSFNQTAFARLFIADIVDQDKALYLDCDTVVCGSLKSLFKLELGGSLAAGVQDTVSSDLRTIVGLKKDDYYVNSGVLMLNLDLWRSSDIKSKIVACIERFNGDVPHNDQGIINAVCHRKMYILPAKYNVHDAMLFYNAEQLKKLYDIPSYYEFNKLEEAKQNPVIIHFTEAHYGRPWFVDSNHPYKELYIHYRIQLEEYWENIEIKAPVIKRVKRLLKQFLYRVLPFYFYKNLMVECRKRKGKSL